MDKNKRRLISNLGSATIWATPIVTSIALPVHGQTSNSIVYAYGNPTGLPIPMSVVVQGVSATIKMRHFFDGGCPICGSDVEYETETDIFGTEVNLVATDYGCGVPAPAVLGTAYISDYSEADPTITVNIRSTEVGDSVVVIPLGTNADLGAFVCS